LVLNERLGLQLQQALKKERRELGQVQVLVAEDSAVYRHLLSSHLQDWGFPFIIAKDGSEAWRFLQRPDCPKLVLLDWVLPDIDGVELCRRIRLTDAGKSYSYVILLTGKDGKTDLLEAMQAGVDDYLVKPFDQLELKARLLVGKRIVELHEQLVAAKDSLLYSATHDFLTGILNRGEVFDSLRRELDRAKRSGKPVSIIMADVDHFKDVNDTLGHSFGDEALKEIARRFRSKLRLYDSLGRYGGEEFLIVLPDCDLPSAMKRADQLRACIGSSPIVFCSKSRSITVSMGVALSGIHAADDITALLNRADRALYAAKRGGRDRVAHFENTPTDPDGQVIEKVKSAGRVPRKPHFTARSKTG
jgi:two-component system, cell cycle response regulator